ncbi:acyclic terpene utilization AtuA family protein [Roseibium sp. RKSG952]|uniref:acyclic terpene utilization AtuA family protein n=1 Tax=Roseibium sp. RKSG952 TaxID=2529384 RepID=UPI0012BD3947|nr:acyclic terpene utilization AtuA family protein [Roseibium sp. RKSG952]MTI00631.1 acyclic terpene utilization AtuA family protein [Roseibium sp. RKSG952]
MVKVLVPAGALGLGYDRKALARGLRENPDIIAIDGGSTDSGPYYLGTGTCKYSSGSVKSEWRELIEARAQAGVPLLIGSAGTCGADSAVDWMAAITREICAELGIKVRLAVLKSGQDAAVMSEALENGRISPLEAAPDISADTLRECTNIVALAGAEQIQAALDTGADIVIAGRTTDTALISALPLARGCHPGAAWHGAKIAECGALATTSPETGTIMVEFDETGFTVTPMAEEARATPHTVSAHMLYENTNPFVLFEPGGHLDVTASTYTPLDERRVRVEGSEWITAGRYTVKLEGARRAGYQTVSLTLVRDPRYVANIHAWCDKVLDTAGVKARERVGGDFDIQLRLIGLNATLGELDKQAASGTEIGILAIATAGTSEASREVAKILNPYLLHHPLTDQEEMPTFAFPFSPAELSRDVLYEFCLYHVLTVDDPMAPFRLTVEEIGQ